MTRIGGRLGRIAVAVLATAAFAAAQADAATITAATTAELQSAVTTAAAGDVISLTGSQYSPNAPLTIARNLTIQGPAAGPVRATINGGAVIDGLTGINDLVRVNPGVTLTLQDLTLASADSFSSLADVSGTLSTNRVTVSGALLNGITVEGGGTLTTLNTTVGNNGFGVVLVAGAAATLRSTTIAGNLSGAIFNPGGSTTALVNTVIDSPAAGTDDCSSPAQSVTGSLGSDIPATCGGGIAAAAPLLASGGVTNNGGQSNTRRLLAGSPALDAGTLAANCPAVDQRGAPRSAAPCDIGAYERDRTAPALPQPADVTVPATGPATTTATFPLPTATEADGFLALGNPVVCAPPSGSAFTTGTTTPVTCTATNVDLLTTQRTFSVIVGSFTAPVVTVPANRLVEATGPNGAVVTYPAATTSNAGDGPTCASAPTAGLTSGSTFPVGITTITCTSANAAGTGSASFTVAVQDTTPPTVTPPANRTAEATGPAGATVTYPSGSATDLVDGARPVTCAPPSGDPFPLGTTTVTCSASDLSGNAASATFSVLVRDTTPPAISVLPGNMTLTATGPGGAVATYTASATDAVAPASPAVACAPPSGTTFALGATTVTCTSTDTAGNTATQTFTVTVNPLAGTPVVTVPASQVVEATGPAGAVVTYPAPFTTNGGAPPTCTSAPTAGLSSGSTFPLGITQVTCRSTSAASSAAFTIAVVDTTAPAVTPPADVTAEATGTAGTVVTFPQATATDTVDGPRPTTCLPASGSVFPTGTTTVVCSATDAHGNVGSGSFSLSVRDTTPPVISVPADIVLNTTSPAGAVATYAVSATDNTAPAAPAVTCAPPSGSLFPLGVTTVSCSATDAAGNVATRTFTVTVATQSISTASICLPSGKFDGRGGTVGTAAWASLAAGFTNDVCGPTPGSPADAAGDAMVSYNGPWAGPLVGSREGVIAAACRSNAFGGSDGPYTQAQLADLRGAPGTLTSIAPGTSCATATNGLAPPFMAPGPWPAAADTAAPLMSFPVGGTAVAPVVNLSGAGCTTTPTSLQFTKEMVDGLFDGSIRAWNDVRLRDANHNGVADGTGVDGALPAVNTLLAGCTGAIVRVVRQDDAGSTHVLKSYLARIDGSSPGCDGDGAFAWSLLRNAFPNTRWPGGDPNGVVIGSGGPTGGTPVPIGLGQPVPSALNPACSPLVSATTAGGVALRALLDQPSFSGVGYLDVAEAVGATRLIRPSVRNGVDTAYVTPSSATRANCSFTVVSPPAATEDGAVGLDLTDTWASDQTLLNRSDVTNSGNGFPICGLTFALVYSGLSTNTNPALNPVNSLTAPQRRALHSFMSYVLSSAGQDRLTADFYQRLPVTLATQIRNGFQRNY